LFLAQRMKSFTYTLSDELSNELSRVAAELNTPHSVLVHNALRMYFTHLKREAYQNSFIAMTHDQDILTMAEEGMQGYAIQLLNS
jgi:predicted transcriptional regulator